MSNIVLFLFLSSVLLLSQDLPPTSNANLDELSADGKRGAVNKKTEGVIPPPVVINGKKADELSDEEIQEFIQSKVKTINQGPDQVVVLNIARGYPMTLEYNDPISEVVFNKSVLNVIRKGSNLELIALQSPDPKNESKDTYLKVFFEDNKIRPYHVLISNTYVKGDYIINFPAFDEVSNSGPVSSVSFDEKKKLIPDFLRIIMNFEALSQNKQIDPQMYRREPLFKKNPASGFTYFYLYRMKGGIAITFAFENIYTIKKSFNPFDLRIEIGGSRFRPDFCSMHEVDGGKNPNATIELKPNQSTTGVILYFNPIFDPKQPFELNWNPRKRS